MSRFLLNSRVIAASLIGLAALGCRSRDHDEQRHDLPHGTHAHIHTADGNIVYADRAQATAALTKAGTDMAQAAGKFLGALNDDQRKEASFEMAHDERYNWHFIPRERKGLPLKKMSADQQELARGLLKSGLSAKGYVSAESIMQLENVLKEMEKGGKIVRDPEMYFVSIFGKPEAGGTWGWRFEGHHLSLNFTIIDGQAVSATPAFMGSNPGEVREGEKKGLRVLASEEDMGRALVTSLGDELQKEAIIQTDAPKEIVSGVNRKADIAAPKGVLYSELSAAQKESLMSLIELYAHRLRAEVAEEELTKIRDKGIENVRFAWAGSVEKGKPHYYRIQGPTFLVEYDNTQNNANHVHTVWRDLTGNDFGEDLLQEHYAAHKHDHAHGHDDAK